ncbi:MAG: amidase [Chloroflexi bacterium]|nr:amidase [Chloroflexota bacterium]
MGDTPLHFKTLTEVGSLIRSKQVSPVEVTEAMLQRIEDYDGRYKSYATVMADHAMAAARAAELEIIAGRYLGTLHGIPIAVKDLCFTSGVPTMGGSGAMRDHVPAFDATVVSRLESAGAVLLGKLNLTEGAMAGYHPDFQIPVNPWDPERWSGASSSGSGVATAAGLCFGSLGSDTGGSIRFPAAACGIVGLKPTWGRVSRYGVLALADSLDHVGPMTRSTADAAVMLQVIAGQDPMDPTSLPAPVPDMLEGLGQGVKGVRIGLDSRYVEEDIDPELAQAVLAGVKVMEGLGAEIIEVRVPDMDDYVAAWNVLCSTEAAVAHRATYPSRRDDYGPWFRGWLDLGASKTGVDYAGANNVRAACNGLLRNVFENIDVLACPSMTTPPGRVNPEELYGPMGDRDSLVWGRFTVPFDFNGAPTLSLPCGLNSDGLPLSLQFVGKHLGEALLCRLGHAYEQATQWHNLRPNV